MPYVAPIWVIQFTAQARVRRLVAQYATHTLLSTAIDEFDIHGELNAKQRQPSVI